MLFSLVSGRSDGADAGGQSRQDGHGAGAAGSQRRRQHPGRRGLHGADVRQRTRTRGDRQTAAGSTGVRRHAQRQREYTTATSQGHKGHKGSKVNLTKLVASRLCLPLLRMRVTLCPSLWKQDTRTSQCCSMHTSTSPKPSRR